jgi:DNA-binding transcriptional MerR regulator
MTARRLRIGDLAAACGVTRDTLRFYERQGLLPRPRRTPGGFREYDGASVERVRFVKQAQAQGLALRDIRALVDEPRDGRGARCRHVRDVLARKLAELEQQRRDLEAACRALSEYLDLCDRALDADPAKPCPVVENLALGVHS